MRHGIRQVELAEKMGYEQSYLSSLESDAKGPPTHEFLERLATTLNLSEAEQERLYAAAEASARKFSISDELPTDTYWMLSELRRELGRLSQTHVRMIRDVLKLRLPKEEDTPSPLPRRLKRRRREEAEM